MTVGATGTAVTVPKTGTKPPATSTPADIPAEAGAPPVPERTAPEAVPAPKPPVASQLVYDKRDGLKNGLRIGFGVGAAALLGVGALTAKNSVGAFSAGKMGIWGGAALGALALGFGIAALINPKKIDIVGEPKADTKSAIDGAAQVGDDAGVLKIPGGDGFSVAAFPSSEDFDNTDLGDLKVGDGRLDFEHLVTRDGDLLTPKKSGGYKDEGAVAPRTDLAAIKATDLTAIKALKGTQLGTDDGHNKLVLGSLVGKETGYATKEAAGKALFELDENAPHAIVKIDDKFFGFKTSGPGPEYYDVQARGTTLKQIPDATIQDNKFEWSAQGVRDAYDFSGRLVAFDTQDPIGYKAYVPSYWDYGSGTIRQHEGSYDSRSTAIYDAVNSAAINNMLYGNNPLGWDFSPDQYFVIKGDTAEGKYNVYAADDGYFSNAPHWDDRYGHVEAAVYKYTESTTTNRRYYDGDTDVAEKWHRTNVRLADADLGITRTVAAGNWQFDGYDYITDYSNTPSNSTDHTGSNSDWGDSGSTGSTNTGGASTDHTGSNSDWSASDSDDWGDTGSTDDDWGTSGSTSSSTTDTTDGSGSDTDW